MSIQKKNFPGEKSKLKTILTIMVKLKNYFSVFLILVIALILLFTINAIFQKQPGLKKEEIAGNDFLKIVVPLMPKELNFCGEKVPLNDIDVKERFERELIVNTYWHSSTILILKRSTRWFPVIEPILKRNGVPDDFKYLCAAESNLSNATSIANAVGFWQFVEKTAKQYGLKITKEIDERYSVEKSTEAACKYLKEAYSKYGSWTMAAASFNIGFDNLDKQIARQKSNDYYDLLFNEETSRYIFRVLAIKTILLNPENYGYILKKDDYYQPIPTYEIKITAPINDLADFAKDNSINYKFLKYFNPWLRENYLPLQKGESYIIKIPKPDAINISLE
ncbi:lytic transglycosylase domain-containing protein [Melioribacteraceae bacterium 4301-Me]|uniref:lytic transglycosylase domain-containing protein n=1 Tax=Pyranulibacter aquaticus TaxID=3163344 RepID=UPI003597E419